MSRKVFKYSAVIASLLATALFTGCGTSNKEGSSQGGSALFGNVGTVGDTACVQCHSATTEAVTGETIVSQYQQNSPHNQSGLGCESCHGGGAQHNGVGPIPFPTPDAARCATCHDGVQTLTVNGVATVAPATNSNTAFSTSVHASGNAGTGPVTEDSHGQPCVRCHSNEGGILGAKYGLTGPGGSSTTSPQGVMDDPTYQGSVPLATAYTAITCDTCHQHGGGLRPVKTRDASGNIVNWNPSASGKANDQFNLCTSCHGLKTNDGTVMASGDTVYNTDMSGNPTAGTVTTPAGHHEDDWYRVIATTHYNNADNTLYGITGYVVRAKGTNPCFDCHAHEARTNTRYVSSDPTKATIYTDWAQSGHAGDLLANKVAATVGKSGVAQVDAAMNANSTAAAWGGDGPRSHDWSATSNQDCQRCHTATGASNFLNNPATYDKTANDFSHLAGWKTSAKASKQREVLYCWGCHSNAGKGVVRNPGAITEKDVDSNGKYTYVFNGSPAAFPNVQESNVCIACHTGRTSGEYIASSTADFSNLGFQNSHYMAAAGLMYVKAGFIAFADPGTTVPGTTTTYGKSLTSNDDGGSVSSTHRVFGTSAIIGNHGITASDTNMTSGGPCVTCHMNSAGGTAKHSLAIDAYAYNSVCVKCHDSEGSKTGPVALTADNFVTAFLEPNSNGFQQTLALVNTLLNSKYGINYNSAAYPYFYDMTLDPTGKTAVKDWTRGGTLTQADAKKLMGACYNLNVLTREPAAYAHARTYTRRLLYDTIDWLDNKTMDLSVSVTANATDPTNFTKGTNAYTDGTLGTIDPSTTEGVLFLLNWSRSTGKWNTASERP
ncbi:MAG: multiheme c-type cytochrome [Geobacteraceae bacterium]|nr:multiheme c-type cytochrome [Geobacteraceae bacterium]